MPGFLEFIQQELDRGIVKVGARSRQLVETTQIRSQIRLLQGRREEGVRELGEVVYKMFQQGPVDQERLTPYLTGLQQVDSQIATLETQLRTVQIATEQAINAGKPAAFAHCLTCGSPLKETTKFCPRCGQEVGEVVQRAAVRRQQVETKTCPSCGADAAPTARFCPSCGTGLTQSG